MHDYYPGKHLSLNPEEPAQFPVQEYLVTTLVHAS